MTSERDRGDGAGAGEDVDLPPERRKEIVHADGLVASWTHWEALGLPWNASAEQARAAYLERVKVFHPDRYPGQRLGTYRPKLERIFRRITEARDVLADEARRAPYARQTAPAAEFARMEARRLEDERRSEEKRARLSRANPLVARAGRIAELVKRGRDALAEGKLAQAAADLLVAQGLDPRNAELAALAAEAKRRAAAQKAADLLHRGLEAELVGSHARALALYREALEVEPKNVRAAAQGSRAALAAGDVGTARELAEAAVRAGPAVGAAHEALGNVLEALGARKEARRELERALELDPKLESAKERLKKLRWSILG